MVKSRLLIYRKRLVYSLTTLIILIEPPISMARLVPNFSPLQSEKNILPVTKGLTKSAPKHLQNLPSTNALGSTRHLSGVGTPPLERNFDPNICLPVMVAPSKIPNDLEECDNHLQESIHVIHPDQSKTTPEFLETYGYPFKRYRVKTEDLYILTVYRIMPPTLTGKKTPVYMNHGILTDSDWWFLQPRKKNLAIMLADAGYDVWLSNSRGTAHSLDHERCNWETELCYWDYGFHEMGVYDVPAVTNFILKETHSKKVLYVAHSMGATQFLIALAELPLMNDKIGAAFLLSPVSFMGHSTNILRNIAPYLETYDMYKAVNLAMNGRLENGQQYRDTFKISPADTCAASAMKCGVCDNFWFSLFGFNAPQANYTEIPHILSKTPTSQSVKTLAHYAHLITSCKFDKFNYKPKTNIHKYGTPQPPEYNLTNINVPVYLFSGEQDNFAVPADVKMLVSRLRPTVVKGTHKVKDKLFNHGDFLTAVDVDKLVYNQILKDMEQHKIRE